MSQYFPKPYEPFVGDTNLKLIFLIMQQYKMQQELIHQNYRQNLI